MFVHQTPYATLIIIDVLIFILTSNYLVSRRETNYYIYSDKIKSLYERKHDIF